MLLTIIVALTKYNFVPKEKKTLVRKVYFITENIVFPLFFRSPYTTGTFPWLYRKWEAGRMKPLYTGLEIMPMFYSADLEVEWSSGSL